MNARNDMIVVKISSYNMIDGNTLGQVRVPGDLANSISIEGEYKYESNTYTFTGAHHNTIKNNRIYPNRSHFGINLDVFPNGSGVWGTNQIYSRDVYNEYNEIAYNIIEGCEAGIYATHQKYLKIHNNFIGYNFKRENDENGFVESDEGHGITMNGRFPKYNGTSNQDFYIWDSESLINNNTIYLSYNMGIHNSHATSVTLFNNLISHNGFYNNTVQPNLNAGKFGMRQANPTINDNFIHNMYFRGATGGATTITDYWRLGSTAVNWTNWTTSQGELNSVETEDPQFRNLPSYPSTIPSPNDFPLLNVSDFISLESSYPQNNGTNSITGISSEDILGNSRSGDWDMGAFEIGEIYPPFIESVNFYDQIVEVNFTEDFYETSRSFYPTIYHISPYNSNFSDVKMLGESWTTTRQYLIETDHHIADNFYILHLNNFSNNLPHFQTIRYKATGLSKKGNYVNKMINFELLQNYPNPFNPYTKINFTIPTSNNVSLILYNILGQEIQSLVNGNLEAGSHSINFDAASLPSGIYFYKLTSGKYTEVRKMQLIK